MDPSTKRCAPGHIEIESTGTFRTRFLARIPAGHSVEDVLSSEYFGLIINTQKMIEGDLIEVEWETLSRHGLLQVRAVEPTLGLLLTRERIQIEDMVDPQADLPEGWSLKWGGERTKWQVFHGDKPIDGGFPTPERARNRIAALSTQQATREAVAAPERKKPGPKPKSPAASPEAPPAA